MTGPSKHAQQLPMADACAFCGCIPNPGDHNCASLEAALEHTEHYPFGCPWLSDKDKKRLTENARIIDWKARALAAEAALRAASRPAQVQGEAVEMRAGAFYKTRGNKNNLPQIVGPLEHNLNDHDCPWCADVCGSKWIWGYSGEACADRSPHTRDLVEMVSVTDATPTAALLHLREASAKIADPWSGFIDADKMGTQDSAIIKVREAIAAAIRAQPIFGAGPLSTNAETRALEDIALLDEADGHELTKDHAFEAVAIATRTLGKHPSQIHAERYSASPHPGEASSSDGGVEGHAAVPLEIPAQRSGASRDPLGDGSVKVGPHREDAAGVESCPSETNPQPVWRDTLEEIIRIAETNEIPDRQKRSRDCYEIEGCPHWVEACTRYQRAEAQLADWQEQVRTSKRLLMAAEARLAEAIETLTEAKHWHEAQDKVLSKSGRSDGSYHYFRDQHAQQIELIEAAINRHCGMTTDRRQGVTRWIDETPT